MLEHRFLNNIWKEVVSRQTKHQTILLLLPFFSISSKRKLYVLMARFIVVKVSFTISIVAS
jgi:hypothetical protein